MKRFIRYLYEYENGKCLRNVGFVRVDQDQGATKLQVHAKGLHSGEKELLVYLIFSENGECAGIYVGQTETTTSVLNYELSYTPEETGVPENYDRIRGVVLKDMNGHWYAALWDEEATDICKMKEWKQAAEKEETTVFPARKMERKDLVLLPRCEWRLANNSFLVHGYHNYHHMILTVINEELKLGVPGVYYPEEEKAAKSMGFPEFVELSHFAIELSEEEKNEQETFGYWCRSVRGSVDVIKE